MKVGSPRIRFGTGASETDDLPIRVLLAEEVDDGLEGHRFAAGILVIVGHGIRGFYGWNVFGRSSGGSTVLGSSTACNANSGVSSV